MRHIWRAALVGAVCGVALLASAARAAQTETIVLVRHGEKPDAGLGQLSCQGLNRALALPAVIARLFGKPAAIFAPDPAGMKFDRARAPGAGGVEKPRGGAACSDDRDEGGAAGPAAEYYYVRPLATIEPSAVRFGMPLNTQFRFDDVAGLQLALEQPAYHDRFVLAAGEHKELEKLARNLARLHHGDPNAVPHWCGDDFDSLYVLRIEWGDTGETMRFEKMQEGLNGLPLSCPTG
jgi:hypothetical protein